MNKKGAIARIIVWAVVAVLLIGLLATVLALGTSVFPLFSKQGVNRMITDTHFDSGAVNAVSVEWHVGEVRITPAADDQVRAVERSRYDVNAMECETSGGRLTIRQRTGWGFFFFGFGKRRSDLELTLPQKQYDELLLSITSGDAAAQGIEASKIDLRMTSGSIRVTDLTAQTLRVKATSGRMQGSGLQAEALHTELTSGRVELSGAFGAIDGNITSGNAEIVSSIMPSTLDYGLTSGKTVIRIPDNDGFSLRLKKTSGSFHSDFDLMAPINDKDGTYQYRNGGSQGIAYAVKMTSGTFRLEKTGTAD